MTGDTLRDLLSGKWRRWQEMQNKVPIVAFMRKGVEDLHLDSDVMEKFKAGIKIVKLEALSEVSSSAVRTKVAHGESVEGMVDSRVLEYIQSHGLYGKL